MAVHKKFNNGIKQTTPWAADSRPHLTEGVRTQGSSTINEIPRPD